MLRWDERTSPARFAGNDSLMDAVFIATRKGNRVTLIRKASGMHDHFATLFRGRIVAHATGSELRGRFGKRLSDYVLLLLLAGLDGFLYWRAVQAGILSHAMSLGFLAFGALLLLLAIPLRSPRKRYRAFLEDILATDEK